MKAEVMDDGWMVGAAVSRLLIPGGEISFLLVSLRLFPTRAPALLPPASTKQRTVEPEAPDIRQGQQQKKTCRPLFCLHGAKDRSGVTQGSTRMAECQEVRRTRKEMGKWKQVKIKDCHPLY